MLLFTSLALAAMGTSRLDAPVPTIADLDLLPEPGAWPCTVTLNIDSLGATTSVDVARGCPSGLTDTAKALGEAWSWPASAGAHAEDVVLAFHMLGMNDPAPKAESTANRLVYLVRPLDLLPALDPADPMAEAVAKLPKPRLPGNAEGMSLVAGSCLVRLSVDAGKVSDARPVRCLDTLAAPALATAKKLKVPKATDTWSPPSELDVTVRFEARD